MRVFYEAPNIDVKFVSVEGDPYRIKNLDFEGEILSLTTKKSLSDPAGSFQMVLVGRESYDVFVDKLETRKKSQNVYDVFRAMTLVDIFINGKEVMLGVIDQITRTVDFKTDKPERSVVITGRDFGSILIDHKIWYDEKLNKGRKYNYALGGAIQALGTIGLDTPANAIQDMYNRWLVVVMNQKTKEEEGQFTFSDGDNIQDKLIGLAEDTNNYEIKQYNIAGGENKKGELLDTVQGPGALSITTYGNYYPIKMSLWQYQGDLLNALKTVVSYPFNEIFVETGDAKVVLGAPRNYANGVWNDITSFTDYSKKDGDKSTFNIKAGARKFQMLKGKAYIVFRPSPYDDSYIGIEPKNERLDSLLTMQDLLKFEVDDSIILSKSLSLGKNNIPTFYHVYPSNGLITGDALKFVTEAEYDEKALRRYGYNPMEAKLEAFNYGGENAGEGMSEDIGTMFQKKLRRWYEFSDRFLKGTMTIKGNEKIRVGNRLEYIKESGDIENDYEEGHYYITGVNHTYIYGQTFETLLTLDRGVSKKIIKKGT